MCIGEYMKDVDKVDWSKVWSKEYPILDSYHNIENINKYKEQIEKLYNQFKKEYNMSNQDTILILKDILYHEYIKNNK